MVLASPTNGAAPLTVGFTGSGSTDDQPGLSHSWDFGDGSPVSNVADPDHEYTSVGTFDAVLTVTDSDGQTDSGTVRITVTGEPGSCPDYLVNGDASLPLPEGVLASGLDSAVMLEGTGAGPGCQLELTNGDGGEPWAKYRIAIDLAANGISAGDELYFSLAGSGTGGAARFQVARDNRPNTFLVDHAYGTGWSTHSQTVTVPSGLSTLDIWIYPNFGVSSAGSARYGDLVVSKGSIGGTGKNILNEKLINSNDTLEEDLDAFVELDKVLVYPNPSSGLLYLNLSSLMDVELNCNVYNSLGQNVFGLKLDANHASNEELNLGHLSSGVYYLQIQSIYGNIFKSIVIEK
ncbi:PKD domain-containing protein [Maribacter halichondriae]|uniref:T9SS type A sorting domain-containing protein n=1 Tax=Maribacter halichondriae TaxID=2980554 RepID=UPI00235A3CCB|nr:PKD domain-containing protein [Maribacter sp. Hal144]